MADAPPVQPLSAEQVSEIIAFLEANGGALPLGKVTRQFKGLKKVQLDQHFILAVGENKHDPVVSTTDLTGEQLAEVAERERALKAERERALKAAKEATSAQWQGQDASGLSLDKVSEITAFLEANGGSMNLGKVSRQFKVKKAQLESSFYIEMAEGAPDFVVSLTPGATFAAAPVAQGRSRSDGPNTDASKAEVPVEPLSHMVLGQITAALTEAGGSMDLGKLTRSFRGVKKAQLERHFTVADGADGAQGTTVMLIRSKRSLGNRVRPAMKVLAMATRVPAVAMRAPTMAMRAPAMARTPVMRPAMGMPGYGRAPIAAIMPARQQVGRAVPVRPPVGAGMGMMMNAPSRPVKSSAQASESPPPLTEEQLQEVWAFVEGMGGSTPLGKLTRQFKGLKKAQLTEHFTISQDEGEADLCVKLPGMKLPGKRQRSEALGLTQTPREEEPVAPMDPAQVQEVTSFLRANGGSQNLGRLTRAFKGLKKAQLVQHFTFTVADNPQDPVVSVSASPGPARATGGRWIQSRTSPGPPAKKARTAATQPAGSPDDDFEQKLSEIKAALETNGGALTLGKLTRQFKGVKRAQLEPHLSLAWEEEARDFVVSISA